MSTRKPIIIGNWKLNHSKASACAYFDLLAIALKSLPVYVKADLAIAPVALMLDFARQKLEDSGVEICAQNVFYEPKGPYTGEWSSEQLHEIGVKYCIVGHSERRILFHESDQDAGKKAKACVTANIVPICCVGETLIEREEGQREEVLKRQLQAFARALGEENKEYILAYEPVWAIGTGLCASVEQAQEAHAYIRNLWGQWMGASALETTRIVYGGSVTPQNIKEIVRMPDVDGVLVGGASLQVESFLAMVVELPY